MPLIIAIIETMKKITWIYAYIQGFGFYVFAISIVSTFKNITPPKDFFIFRRVYR